MSRNPEYKFISTDPAEILAEMTRRYEEITKTTVRPASPEYQFICWVTDVIIAERVHINYTGNQNIPSRAEGENLDALAEFYPIGSRPGKKPATCTMRFYISEPQDGAVPVPMGTRVTDVSRTLIWETTEDVYVRPGEKYVDTAVTCQTEGTSGNGYAVGQINTLVDIYDYYSKCENITPTDGGSEIPDDDEFYEMMRASEDSYSTAGPIGGYVYHAKRVSTEIGDVVPNSPTPGTVYIYVLMRDGKAANETIKRSVFAICNADDVRPLTDQVIMGDPEAVPYDIDLTYYIPSDTTKTARELDEDVKAAVQQYVEWQSGKLGRDINPSKLYQLIMGTGIKRVVLRFPVYKELRSGKLEIGKSYQLSETVPQIASLGQITVTSGGYEDE